MGGHRWGWTHAGEGRLLPHMQRPTALPPPTCGAAGGVVDCHLAALSSQGEGNRLADAAARARHQAHAALHCVCGRQGRVRVKGWNPDHVRNL